MSSNLEQITDQAKKGNRKALETLVSIIQNRIFGLALRMLNNPQDAEDETQEILIKIITHLSSFREESTFNTWLYRITCNHLLTRRKQKNQNEWLTFELLDEMKNDGNQKPPTLTASGPERALLIEEIRLSCMQATLSCLKKEMRIVFILGQQYGVTSKEGALILGITPELFRKRLSRGKKLVQTFMIGNTDVIPLHFQRFFPTHFHRLTPPASSSTSFDSSYFHNQF